MASIKYILLVFIVSLTISNSIQCEYDKCPDPWNPSSLVEHTMCQYSAVSFGQKCNNDVRSSSLEDTEKNIILNRHNELRAQVAAGKELRGSNGGQPAGVIAPLKWDNELALVAQRWANQCEFSHDKCRNLGGIRVGQNLGYKGSSGNFKDKFVDIVTSWYDEVIDFDSSLVSNYQSRNGTVTTHYTRLIWAKTTHIGCGGVKYYDGQFYKIHLVCNYSPGGNMGGESVYSFEKQPDDNPDIEVPPHMLTFQTTDEPDDEIPSIQLKKQPGKTPAMIARSRIPKLSIDEAPRISRSRTTYPIQSITPPSNHVSNKLFQHYGPAPIMCRYEKCRDQNGAYEDHTMCKYPNANTDAKCNQVQKLSLTNWEINNILHIHNVMNHKINSKAKNRGEVAHKGGVYQWNPELAAIAQRWANQCSYQHDTCRNIYKFKVEQNVGQVSSFSNQTIPFSYIVKQWYDILKNHGSNQKHSDNQSSMLNIFTQLNWFHPTAIGCGGIKYIDTNGSFTTYLVCNYLARNNNGHSIQQPSDYAVDKNRDVQKCEYHMCADSQNQYNNHTMCEYPASSVSAACYEPLQTSFSQLEKDRLLEVHNYFRKYLGNYLTPLKWNKELAEIAQRWANQCIIGHDKCRNLVDGTNSGQIIGIIKSISSLSYEFSDVIYSWVDVTRRDLNKKSEFAAKPNLDINFYNQIISNKTTDVGCGGVKYKDPAGDLNTYLVCNYSPSGPNYVKFTYDIHEFHSADVGFP